MKSNVSISRHPLHPILVLIPVGAWITSFVLDVVFLATANTFWFVAAMWVMIVGIGGALVAATTGFIDLFTLQMSREPKNIGLWHMTLNLTITALYIINVLAVRWPVLASPISTGIVPGDSISWAFGLNLISVVLLLVSGWLGGEMIYRWGVAVPRATMEKALRREPETVPGGRMAGTLGGERHEDEEKQE